MLLSGNLVSSRWFGSFSLAGVWIDVCVFLWCFFQQVNEDRVQQMERENSFITRWNEKKDATVSRPSRTEMESTDGCSVCLCVGIDLPVCVRALSNQGFIWASFLFFSAKMKRMVGWGGSEVRGRRRRQEQAGEGKKGFVPVNLYGRYFMPGCLRREKHLVQITGGKN